ncbi:MAG: outer membrane beta-barrel protein, partial [Candidatus Aminicenantes bacterium]|nr:outer membrane beta-barrel protein [Candidatus Aminicenantes bacterium]
MHKRTFLTFFLVCFLFLIQNALGQEESGMRIHGSLGISSMTEKNIGSSFWSGFGFSVPIKKNVFLSFNFGAWKSQVSSKPDGLQDGSLTMNPFFASLTYFLRLGDGSITPYLFIGGGYIFSSFRTEDVVTIPEITFSQKIDNSPGGQVGAGIKMELSKR